MTGSTTRARRGLGTFFLAAAFAGGAVVVGAQATSAKPIEREHYSGTFEETFVEDECGDALEINYTNEWSGLFMLKAPRGDNPTPYFFDNYSGVETYTNALTGATAQLVHNGIWKDIKIELIEDTTYRFTALEAGRPVVVIGPDGQRLVFDAGAIMWTFVVDTKGDQDLDNDVWLEDPTPDARGPHPILENGDFCEFVDLIR